MDFIKSSTFKVDIYECKVNVIVVPNKFETTKYYYLLHKKLKIKPSTEDNSPCEGFVLLHGLKGWVVLSKDHLTIQTITHEAVFS